MNFNTLVTSITQTHSVLQQATISAINQHLTIRNWLIGFYIVHFEQKGEDRAKYGDLLLKKLAVSIKIKGLSETTLRLNRQFYLFYPQVYEALPNELKKQLTQIHQTVSDEFHLIENESIGLKHREITETNYIPATKLLSKLSFSHIVELMQIKDNLKRLFYEIECIKGNWGVRELSRQINSLYFERCGMSQRPDKLSALVAQKAETLQPEDVIKSVYAFEFLGLHPKEVVEESKVETALLDHLQEFMLEMGHGFCLEARQKKILIGDEHYFVDIVFYHRILKCHVLLELKMEKFQHWSAGQLHTYLNYYKKEVMQPDDNPPVGILLVTNKNETLVEYATAGMDNKLFVSKYLAALPDKKQLEKLVAEELRKL